MLGTGENVNTKQTLWMMRMAVELHGEAQDRNRNGHSTEKDETV